jgi:hypothetical protein
VIVSARDCTGKATTVSAAANASDLPDSVNMNVSSFPRRLFRRRLIENHCKRLTFSIVGTSQRSRSIK